MILHHEVLQATGMSALALLSYVCLGVNAAAYYGRRAMKRLRQHWQLARRGR